MAERLRLTVVTPDRLLVSEEVDEIQIPGLGGYLGILPGHAPLFSALAVGELSYSSRGRTQAIAVAGGFVEVLNDEVRVLADAAEAAAEIDMDRAVAARTRAEQLISKGGVDVDYDEAQAALQRALTRIQVAGKFRRAA